MTYIENEAFPASMLTAFGTLETAELEPIFQSDFVYGLNTQRWNTATVSGTGAAVDTDARRLRIQSGTDGAGYAYITSKIVIRYRAGQGNVFRATPIFATGTANNTQLWGIGSIASNVPYDGYFFGYNGTTFGIVHYIAGTPTWVARASWNGDKVDGTAGTSFNWNPAYGTPVQIKYPYLGYGNILFQVQNPTTSQWVTVHTIKYANTTATTQLANPSLQVMGFILNSGNTSNLIMYMGSVSVFLSGARSFISNPKWAADNNKSGITTETCLLNIRNCTTFNGVTNRGVIRLNYLSFGSANNSLSVCRLKLGVTIGGSPSYSTVNGSTADGGVTITSGNSVASVDTAGTTVTGGTYLFNVSVGQNSNISVDLTPLNILIAPGEILTVSGFATASSVLGASVNWSEDI